MEEKEKLLDGLWVGWAECIRDIEILDRDEGILKQKDESLSVDNQHEAPDETVDDEAFDRLVEEIKIVGRVWVKKMEDSEKVCILFGILALLSAYLFYWTIVSSPVASRKSRMRFSSSNSLLQPFSFDLNKVRSSNPFDQGGEGRTLLTCRTGHLI